MDAGFWLQKWEKNEIAFHKSEPNPLLVRYFEKLSLTKGNRIFLPLCGMTLDITWLLSQGYRDAGAELAEIAIERLFMSLKVKPQISQVGEVKHYSAQNIDIFVGDIFELSSKMLGPVNAIYDRAALVALPAEIRKRYTAHLIEITEKASQLLISYEYDQNLMSGPPFSISQQEVNQHYERSYEAILVANNNVPGGLKGKCAASEHVWLLKNNG